MSFQNLFCHHTKSKRKEEIEAAETDEEREAAEKRLNDTYGHQVLEQDTHLETLMKRADDALYEVKKSGKGRFAKA